MQHHITLIIGGAASGKSLWAENYTLSATKRPLYIATAQPFDTEMEEKIAAHRARRTAQWELKEAPLDLVAALSGLTSESCALIDCLTMWLSNHLLADTPLEPLETDLLKALSICPAQLVLVTNEVGYSVVPENALARKFRTAQGQLNQRLAAAANKVVLVTAGLPLVLKSADP
ncbi:MAG: bifunctional adenosylcobinamide kinase/adenosylcobinamide-phosphate guanylyltransferase [Rhodobacteraceae bacterium]|nr:bifunctional adenosylcobinamide kinase/adenosylcobinamide-phosphate guanylyltransferase [Paracoccaceae bacterium]MBL6639625.1 bifunctional adenosylcobinamide kinase/adenosylcobinamide-phosphate guanylyltransferase [Paracoccaceae bacterium]MBL6675965.1 bifunctional adenosylcobinamide kinase/adenosylcobinamide-phosphate guanylyltransferase [Paracoccaceae bacterium]MBL6788746.1 bifunctional adenosylcobinamide kinase/adenosylcobinamide-phosphate guanylyltransferase [Paracoccaceae bacterium]MBL68